MSFRWAIRGVLFAALAPVGMSACGGSDANSDTRAAASTAPPTGRRSQRPRMLGRASRSVSHGSGRFSSTRVGAASTLFKEDKPGKALCTSDYLNCTTSWPPLMTAGRPRGEAGVTTRLVGSIHRTKPTGSQVTYNGHPLYLYIDDKHPGDVKGQGRYSYWYVLAPSGRPITKK